MRHYTSRGLLRSWVRRSTVSALSFWTETVECLHGRVAEGHAWDCGSMGPGTGAAAGAVETAEGVATGKSADTVATARLAT